MEMGQTNGSASLCSSLDCWSNLCTFLTSSTVITSAESSGNRMVYKDSKSSDGSEFFFLKHSQTDFMGLKSKEKGTTVHSFSKAMLSHARFQSLFKFAITAQQNYAISLPNQFICSSWQVKQPIFHQHLPITPC